MAGLPLYEGPHEQMHGYHAIAGPKNRELDTPLPVPEGRVGDVSHLETPETRLPGGHLAACVEPAFIELNTGAEKPRSQHLPFSGVRVELV